jgi:hypothetical protein
MQSLRRTVSSIAPKKGAHQFFLTAGFLRGNLAEQIASTLSSKGNVVLVAAHIVKRFKHLACQLGTRVSNVSKFRNEGRGSTMSSSRAASVVAKMVPRKRARYMGRSCMMVGFVECCFRCCQSRKIVRRWWVWWCPGFRAPLGPIMKRHEMFVTCRSGTKSRTVTGFRSQLAHTIEHYK